jgi:hypothetical protein
MIVAENPAKTVPGNMYPSDIIRAAASILEIQTGLLLVQLSTYSAKNSPQDKIIPIAQWIMAAVGLELLDTVRADGHMMSMIFARGVTHRSVRLHDRFKSWLALAARVG